MKSQKQKAWAYGHNFTGGKSGPKSLMFSELEFAAISSELRDFGPELSVSDAAKLLNTSRSNLQNEVRAGRIKQTENGKLPYQDLINFAAKRTRFEV